MNAGALTARLRGQRLAALGLALVTGLALAALLAPVLPLADPHATHLEARLLPAGAPGHPLGTDALGRDLLSRLVWGLRSSLAVGLFAVAVAALAGTLIGLVAGYLRGWTDTVTMRGVDVVLAFPYLLLALAIVAALGPGLMHAMVAIAVVNVPLFARTVRATVLDLGGRDFVAAARLGGAGPARILVRELLPNVLPVVVVLMATNLGWMVLETAGLSFLGLGAQPPAADLGSMLGAGREFLTTEPRVAVLPGLVIGLLVVGINLAGDGVRDLLDPRLRGTGGGCRPRQAAAADGAGGGGALLRVSGLTAELCTPGGPRPVVEDVDFSLQAGERVGLVGESGSGKTVTALALLRLLPAGVRLGGGRVFLGDQDLTGLSEARMRPLRGARIAYVPQDPQSALSPLFTVGDQLVETLRAHRRLDAPRARSQALALLEQVGLPDAAARLQAYPHQLSGGQRQRVLIALALANGPEVVIADEATTALDVTVQAGILDLLDGLCARQGAALLFISHDLAVVGRLCSRVLVMYAGQVVEEAPVEALLAHPRHPYTRALLACVPELGRPNKALPPIPGQPPPPGQRPAGCRFAPRCPHAAAACRGALSLSAAAPGHRVRCARHGELFP